MNIVLDLLFESNDDLLEEVLNFKSYFNAINPLEYDDIDLLAENVILKLEMVCRRMNHLFDMAVIAYQFCLIEDETMDSYRVLVVDIRKFASEVIDKVNEMRR